MKATFPLPCPALNMNDNLHWTTKRKRISAWRKAAWAASFQLAPVKGKAEFTVSLPVKSLKVRRDPHNWYPTLKAILDGVVDGGVLPDDSSLYVVTSEPTFNTDGHVVITITELAVNLNRPDWHEHAACVDQIDIMYGPQKGKHSTLTAARLLCAGCPVRVVCRAEADSFEKIDSRNFIFGVRAGETPRERIDRRLAVIAA